MTRRRTGVAALIAVVLLGGVFVVGRATAPDHADRTTTAHVHVPAVPSSADIGFAQDMATHHDQAVLMAQLAQTRGTAAVRAIAEGIVIGQSQEVGLLRGWLRLWHAPGVSQHPMAWMGMSMPAGSTAMPGMATSPQLQRLYNLTGRRFDLLFLQLMIRHHEGGLLMTRAALADHTLATTKTAARGISSEQIEELGTMRALLAADGGRTLPVPS